MIRKKIFRVAALASTLLGVAGWQSPVVLAQPGDSVASAEETVRSTYKNVIVERVTEKTTVVEQKIERKVKDRYRCAIFVVNRAEKIDDKKVLVMQDLFTGHGTDKGLEIIAREDVLNAVANLAKDGPNKGDPKLAGAQMDAMLANNAAALRLAGDMNADYVLVISLTSFGTNKQEYKDPTRGINVVSVTSQMKATFKLLDGTLGGAQTAGVATASIMDRAGPGNVIIRETVVDDLIDAVSADMTSMLADRLKAGRVPDAAAGRPKQPNQFELHVGVADMVFPEIVKNEKGEYMVTAGRYKLEQMAVTVELNGVVIGTTPGPFTAKPGLHKMRLRRAMFRDWEGTVNIADGQVLQIAMQMTPEGLQQFAAMTKFMQELKLNTILTDAQAKMWEGYAKQLEQSGFRVDRKVNINKNIQHDSKDLKEKPAEPQTSPAPAPSPSPVPLPAPAPAPEPSRTIEDVPPAPAPGDGPGNEVNRGDSKPPLPAPLPTELPGTPR